MKNDNKQSKKKQNQKESKKKIYEHKIKKLALRGKVEMAGHFFCVQVLLSF
jgi:hypothetical protein